MSIQISKKCCEIYDLDDSSIQYDYPINRWTLDNVSYIIKKRRNNKNTNYLYDNNIQLYP